MQWSPKSIEVIAKCDLSRITLLEGVVRSSKSYTADFIVIKKLLPTMPPCNVLISGYSSDSARQNIIAEWQKKLKTEFKEHRDSNGTYYTVNIKGLHNKRFYIRGGGKNGDEKGIKGITFGLWYGDEITEHTDDFIQMAMTRMSMSWSKVVWTTNPAGPTNFIKVNFIDKESEKRGFFQSFKFKIYDNPSLDENYIRSLYMNFHGVFRERNIFGKWVAAEGHIFNMLDDGNKTDYIPTDPEKIYIGVDYGTSNMTVFLKVYVERGVSYIVDEYEHSGMESANVKTPADYVDDLKYFIGKDFAVVDAIYADPSANYFIASAKKAGVTRFRKAKNDVLEGIQTLQNVFAKNIVRFNRTKAESSFKQISGYRWDKKAQERGEDKPIKKDDHYADCLRYIVESMGSRVTIKALTTGQKRQANKLTKEYNKETKKRVAKRMSRG